MQTSKQRQPRPARGGPGEGGAREEDGEESECPRVTLILGAREGERASLGQKGLGVYANMLISAGAKTTCIWKGGLCGNFPLVIIPCYPIQLFFFFVYRNVYPYFEMDFRCHNRFCVGVFMLPWLLGTFHSEK